MSYSVLVVDDEDLTLRTVSRGLRQEGFEVFTASSGEDALKVFAEEQPDLTLLDIVLPGIDGVEVLRRMKEANNAAIILMMSAYHMVDRAVEAMKLGAYDYLVKPFHLADIAPRCTAQPRCWRYACGCAITWNWHAAATISGKSSR